MCLVPEPEPQAAVAAKQPLQTQPATLQIKADTMKEITGEEEQQKCNVGIEEPAVDANNFEKKPPIMTMVQQHQFNGLPPNLHLQIFLKICKTFQFHGVSNDAIRLRLFPFYLAGRARALWNSLEKNSIDSWNKLAEVFLTKYFPPSKTAQIRNDITSLSQKECESLYEAWERFKELQRICPHHGLEKRFIVQTFSNGCNYGTKSPIDAAAGGVFMDLSVDNGYQLLDNMALHHNQSSSERNQKGEAGKYEVDTMTMIAAKLDAMNRRIEQLNMN